jgi:phosphoglucosamine mutase
MPRYFGTDGVRGLAYSELTVRMAQALGAAAVRILGPRLLIGRDTRLSGPGLEVGLIEGINAAGGQALLAGVVPTPAVAWLVREHSCDGGIVISASHNPPEYNGIKFFDRQGYKLGRACEDELEAALQGLEDAEAGDAEATGIDIASAIANMAGKFHAVANTEAATVPEPRGLGLPEAAHDYVNHAVRSVQDQGIDLRGLRIVVDCAHGAAGQTTPQALRLLGAEVLALNSGLDGSRINVGCGSTDLEGLRQAVLETKADLGFAHDGDADRVLFVDGQGNTLDGDHIKAICARDLKSQGLLAHDTVVSTVMANLGLIHAMEESGITLIQTEIGDSKVLAAMREGGFVLGGEQSGHIIFLGHNSTGDGLVSALQLLAAMRRAGKTLAEMASCLRKYPQELISVTVADKQAVASSSRLVEAAQAAQAELGKEGRVLVRASGTEPKVRVMVEAGDAKTAKRVAQELADLAESL